MALLHVDVCIIGNELAGLATGALLAQMGYRVVVVDDGESYDAKPLGDYVVPTFPHVWQIPESGPPAYALERLELKAEMRQIFGPKSELAITRDPSERIIATPDKTKLNIELHRAFGEQSKKLAWGLQNFDPNAFDPLFEESSFLDEITFWGRLKAKKRVTKAGQSATILGLPKNIRSLNESLLANFLSPLIPYLQYQSSLPFESVGGYLALRAFTGGTRLAAHHQVSSYAALKSVFTNSLLRHGGEILHGQKIIEIDTQKKRITSLSMDGRNNYIPGLVIDATSARELSPLFSDKELGASLSMQENQLLQAGQTVILRWLLPKSAIPRAMPAVAACHSDGSDSATKGILGIFHPCKQSPLNQSLETQTETELVAAVMAMWSDEKDVEKTIGALREMTNRMLPFAEGSRLAEDIILGAEANHVWPQFEARGTNLNRLSGRPLHTPIANLLRTARDVAPALGTDGEITVALAGAKAANAMLKKKEWGLFGVKGPNFNEIPRSRLT